MAVENKETDSDTTLEDIARRSAELDVADALEAALNGIEVVTRLLLEHCERGQAQQYVVGYLGDRLNEHHHAAASAFTMLVKARKS